MPLVLYLGTREREQDSERVGTMPRDHCGAPVKMLRRSFIKPSSHHLLLCSAHELDCERGDACRCWVPGPWIVRSARRFSCSIRGSREAANSKRLLLTDTEGGHFLIDYDVVLTGVSKVCIAIGEDTGSLHLLLGFGTLLS